MSSPQPAVIHIDASHLACPLPLLKLKKALHQHVDGSTIILLTTDPNSQADIRRFCEVTGHRLVSLQVSRDKYEFTIQK